MTKQLKLGEAFGLLVEQWAAVGLSQENMCDLITKRARLPRRMKVETLQKHFKNELATGGAQATAAVAGALYKKALDGSVDAAKFWLDRRGGDAWKGSQALDLTTGGQPLAAAPAISSDEVQAAVQRALDAVK